MKKTNIPKSSKSWRKEKKIGRKEKEEETERLCVFGQFGILRRIAGGRTHKKNWRRWSSFEAKKNCLQVYRFIGNDDWWRYKIKSSKCCLSPKPIVDQVSLIVFAFYCFLSYVVHPSQYTTSSMAKEWCRYLAQIYKHKFWDTSFICMYVCMYFLMIMPLFPHTLLYHIGNSGGKEGPGAMP